MGLDYRKTFEIEIINETSKVCLIKSKCLVEQSETRKEQTTWD